MLSLLSGYWRAFLAGPAIGVAKAIAVVLAAVIFYRAARAAIRRVFISGPMRGRYLDKRRSDTLASALTSLLRYTIYFLVLGTLLPLLGVNISALLAAAGIGGVALAFGAQHLIRDVINGFFILFEDQMAVGDQVTAAGVTGHVEEAGLRITRIRDGDGRLHIIPNSQITQVTNLSTPARLGQVDVPLGPRAELVRYEELVRAVCTEFAAQHEGLAEGPRLAGLVSTSVGPALRVTFKAVGGGQDQLEMLLRRALYQAVTGAGLRWRAR
ncbi:MAG: mechanosensitive ion channel family protein [Bacteroidota bacterium]